METSIPVVKLNLKKVVEELNQPMEKIESEDEKIAQLSTQIGWEALRERLQRKIKALEESTKITSSSVVDIEDIELYGFKCLLKDLLVEAYEGIINDVDLTAQILTEKKNGK